MKRNKPKELKYWRSEEAKRRVTGRPKKLTGLELLLFYDFSKSPEGMLINLLLIMGSLSIVSAQQQGASNSSPSNQNRQAHNSIPSTLISQAHTFYSSTHCVPSINDAKFNQTIIGEACHHSNMSAANKIAGANYKLGTLNQRTVLIADTLLSPAQLKNMEKNVKAMQQEQDRNSQYCQLQMAKFQDPKLTNNDRFLQYALFLSLRDALTATKTKTFTCFVSTSFSIGKFIAGHILLKREMPILIGIAFKTESIPADAALVSQGIHVLPDHTTLLVIPQTDAAQQKIQKLKKIISENSKNGELLHNKNTKQIPQILETLNLQVCDAWAGDQKMMNEPRDKSDPIYILKTRPDLFESVMVISEDDLNKPPLQKTIDFVFKKHQPLWSTVIQEKASPETRISPTP